MLSLPGVSGMAGAEEPATETLPAMKVIGVTPIHGVGLPKEKIPVNVQSATSENLERSHNLDLTNYQSKLG